MDEATMRSRVDGELRRYFDASSGFDLWNLDSFLKTTCEAELLALKEDPAVRVYEKIIPGPQDNPELKVRIYEPAGRRELIPGALFFHGGGFLFGSVYRQDDLCQRLCKHADIVVVSVEYRLAPVWKAPAPVEDGYAALRWLDQRGASVGVDSSRFAVAGLSAGGNIAAALCLMTRDRKGPQPVLQMPLYASLDNRFLTFSSRDIISPKVWSYPYSVLSWETYLDNSQKPDSYAVPALCEDLSGLPPLFSYVGGLDPFRDENIAYWNRLMEAGITAEFHVFSGCFHCFEIIAPDTGLSRLAYETTYAALRRALHRWG